MDDKDRTLKALEDMKESMAYAVRRKQQIGHEAVPIANGGASTEESGTPNPDKVICPSCVYQFRAIPVNVQAQLREIRTVLWACQRWHNGDKYRFSEEEAEVSAWQDHADMIANTLAKVDGTARETSTVAQDK